MSANNIARFTWAWGYVGTTARCRWKHFWIIPREAGKHSVVKATGNMASSAGKPLDWKTRNPSFCDRKNLLQKSGLWYVTRLFLLRCCCQFAGSLMDFGRQPLAQLQSFLLCAISSSELSYNLLLNWAVCILIWLPLAFWLKVAELILPCLILAEDESWAWTWIWGGGPSSATFWVPTRSTWWGTWAAKAQEATHQCQQRCAQDKSEWGTLWRNGENEKMQTLQEKQSA